MSLFNLPIGSVQEIATKITDNSATVIVGGTDDAWYVPRLVVGENNGGTPNLTVDIYDGSTAYYQGGEAGSLWNAKAVTAKQAVIFLDLYIPANWTLRVTSSDGSGHFDVTGVTAVVTKIA